MKKIEYESLAQLDTEKLEALEGEFAANVRRERDDKRRKELELLKKKRKKKSRRR
jgi:hypothetical protein